MKQIQELDILKCQRCGKETLRRGAMQKYCAPCSMEVDRSRKADWARSHPQQRDPAEARAGRSRMVESGALASLGNSAGMMWLAEGGPDLSHLVRVSVPFSTAFSKNAVWNYAKGHVYARQEANAVRDDLAARISNAGGDWFEAKVWIDLFVEKPNAKSDAINVLDLVCDAVKMAIGVDDRWFSIRRLDWSIVKTDPKIYVGVGQNADRHYRACSHCGKIKPLAPEHFHRSRGARLGFGRACKECLQASRKTSRVSST